MILPSLSKRNRHVCANRSPVTAVLSLCREITGKWGNGWERVLIPRLFSRASQARIIFRQTDRADGRGVEGARRVARRRRSTRRSNTWSSTDGGRHTDGEDEQTARRRTRSLQSLPRRWRCRRKSCRWGERGERGLDVYPLP